MRTEKNLKSLQNVIYVFSLEKCCNTVKYIESQL